MQYLYLVKSEGEINKLSEFEKEFSPLFDKFSEFLKSRYRVNELPRSIVLTDYETATHYISDIPLPGYTNDYRTVFAPDSAMWKKLYLKQLAFYEESAETEKIRNYYNGLSVHNVCQILGHEAVHHSEYFIDEAYEKELWFEEGFSEYISRKYFLSDSEFEAEKEANEALVALYDEKFTRPALNEFCAETYQKGLVHVFYIYWRSFLAADALVKMHGGDVLKVFDSYGRWFESGAKKPLWDWFLNN